MAWYEQKTCAVCEKTIGKRYLWQAKPRVLDANGNVRDAGYVAPEQADQLLRSATLVCPSCYFNRFGEAKAITARRAAPER